ncbi:MAG: radical SAM family heme chaperone HemW [Spirochaetaceae bacterium]|nr:radical SAM family heme chaperone HemW [Spirochaetaceae bacterium]
MFFDAIPRALYIHIPFCKKKCSYCDFFSIPITGVLKESSKEPLIRSSSSKTSSINNIIDNILEETINQISYFNNLLNINALKTIYMGGGTPSAIGREKLEKIIQAIVSVYNALPEEFSIEINPETVSPDLLKMLNNLPVTRISLGVQSFNRKVNNILGRNSAIEATYNALEMLKEYSDKEISIDLISSIPGQTIEEALSDITTALSFKPDHISLYYLTLEEGTKLHKKFTEKDQDDRCWIESCELLEASGYEHYEISNFSQPGKECLHNINYWKMEPYIGCGLSAVSTYYSNGQFYRISVTDDPAVFLQGKKSLWGMEKEAISNHDFLIELLMMGLRTKEGVCLEKISNFFNIDLEKVLEPVILEWDKKGFITPNGYGLALNSKGRYFHSSFMIDIMNCIEKVFG